MPSSTLTKKNPSMKQSADDSGWKTKPAMTPNTEGLEAARAVSLQLPGQERAAPVQAAARYLPWTLHPCRHLQRQ